MPGSKPTGHLSDDLLGSRSFAIVGTGLLAEELAQQLESLGAGRIDHYGRSSSPAASHGAAQPVVHGAAERALTLGEVTRHDTVFVTDEDAATVDQLNELCLLTGVRFVVVGSHGATLTVCVYPFGTAADAACHACNGGDTSRHGVRSNHGDALTHRIAAGFALALGLPEATPGLPVSRRLTGSSLQGRAQTLDVLRDGACVVCSNAPGPVRVVRTRNRWGTPADLSDVGPATLQQVVQLSDAIVTGVTCSACGVLPAQQATPYLQRRAADSSLRQAACPGCARTGLLHFSGQREFTLAQLAERFGNSPAPVRYAIARLEGGTVCLDLGDGAERRSVQPPVLAGAFVAGFGPIEGGTAEGAGAAGLAFRPDDG
jgi:hypothetical protein